MAIQTLDQIKAKWVAYRAQSTRFFNRPTQEELALSNACEDRENALLDAFVADLDSLIAVEAERTQQKEEHKDDTRTTATRLVPTPDATAGKD